MTNTTVFVTIVLGAFAANLGIVITLMLYLGGRIEKIDTSLSARIDNLDGHVQLLREDVAVLKATAR